MEKNISEEADNNVNRQVFDPLLIHTENNGNNTDINRTRNDVENINGNGRRRNSSSSSSNDNNSNSNINNNNNPSESNNMEVLDESLILFQERMKKEKERLDTFKNWPLNIISPLRLAKYGFYYSGEQDIVKCIFCKGTVMEWQEGDDPLTEHRKHFPRCPFIIGYNVENVPINEDPIRTANRLNGSDACGIHFNLLTITTSSSNTSYKIHSLPINGCAKDVNRMPSGPKNSDYVTYASRLSSFTESWPKNSEIKPEKLAEAGFFHIGVDDYVKCFYCDGGLCHWEKQDDPWAEHSRWFPDCDFVRLMKFELDNRNNSSSNSEPSTSLSSSESSDDENMKCTSSDEDSALASESNTPLSTTPSVSPTPCVKKTRESIGLLCKICLDLDVNVVFDPCMHAISCVSCAVGISNCPICRQPIVDRKRLYFS